MRTTSSVRSPPSASGSRAYPASGSILPSRAIAGGYPSFRGFVVAACVVGTACSNRGDRLAPVRPSDPILRVPTSMDAAAEAAPSPQPVSAAGAMDGGAWASGCAVENRTSRPVELMDTAIELPLGRIAPGGVGRVGGHFSAQIDGRPKVHGYCSVGSSLAVVERSGRIRIEGQGSAEGVGK